MKLTKATQKQLDKAYDTLIQVCLYDKPLKDMDPYLADDVMNFGAGKKEITKTKAAFLKQIKGQKKLAAGLKMDFKINPVLRKIINKGGGAIYSDDIVNTVWINEVENKLKFRLSFIFEYRNKKWILVHSHTSAPDSQRTDNEIWPVEELKKRTAVLEKSLDEKIAELQIKNRELEIESSLEKVRVIALSMKAPVDMPEVCKTIALQLQSLGLKEIRNVQTAIFYESRGIYMNYEYYARHDKTVITETVYTNHEVAKAFAAKMLKGNGEFYITHIKGKKVAEWLAYQKTTNVYIDHYLEKASSLNYYWYSLGPVALGISTYAPTGKKEIKLFKRFLNVFKLAYTRYLDIEQAATQALEAKIELALERVRARTMAMQKSDELAETVHILFQQFKELGEKPDQATIGIINENEWVIEYWVTMYGNQMNKVFKFSIDEANVTNKIYEAWKKQKKSLVIDLSGKELYDFTTYRAGMGGAAYNEAEKRRIINVAFFSKGLINVQSTETRSVESIQLLERFAKVFEQTYTRFNDLQKAEAQVLEAQIEASLERVRSRSMGMQKSEELKEVIKVVYDQFVHLNIHIDHAGFVVDYKPKDDWHFWIADQHEIPSKITHPYFDSVWANQFDEAKEKGIDFFATNLNFEEKNKFYQGLLTLIPGLTEEVKEFYFNCPGLAGSTVLLDNVGLYIENFDGIPYTDEENKTLMRFGKVFQQTYTRFLDLQKVEAQVMEAKIEAALERVRSRTMAMQNSNELAELVATVFTELNRLEFALTSCIIWINNPELLTAEMWVASTEMNKPPEPYYIKPFQHPYFKSVINAFKEKNKNWVYEMKSKEKKVFQEAFFNEVGSFPTIIKHALEAPDSVIYSASFFNFGAVEIIGTEKITDEKFEILHRLGKVFDMSYTRFKDLKQAEAQAREAKIEAALERIRSRTLAMQKSDELAETSAVVFRQLIDLGIEPNRLYMVIMKETTGIAEFWITDEDGSRISSGFTANLKDNRSFMKMFEGWKKQKKSIIIDMQGKELAEYFRHLSMDLKVPFQSGLSQQRRVQSIAYFSKGFIGIASPETQPDATVNLLIRFASVFNLTYTRFNDLKFAEYQSEQARLDLVKLQTEKKRAEEALTELKATQSQLIQSEKMASLGELTAGIAHEIQNPLNFVNNFSEVSTELIDEMYTEIEQGNFEDARQIAEDLKQNLEKINHHGKRAGDIVKGMLQHSRSSSTTKEPTDINKLADEYLRLAYHGLRAKDNTFSATMKTDYDETIGNINIIPQDIGRVILNLITNAFYVVNEKKKQQPEDLPADQAGYEPTVSVSTKKTDATVLISVKDNGNGIPPKVVDKIFQPFFTTKPTGQGTGLGLSLSYDIVKAYGGEIKVETEENDGAEFIIQLPVV
jgi:signal transduction histidine kinase